MNPVEIEILIKGTKGVTGSLSDVQKRLEELAKKTEAVQDELDDFAQAGDYKGMISALEKTKSLITETGKVAQRGFHEANTSVTQFGGAIMTLNKELASAQEAGDTAAIESLTAKIGQLEAMQQEAISTQKAYGDILDRCRKHAFDLGNEISKTKEELAEFERQSDSGSGSVRKFDDNGQRLAMRLRELNDAMTRMRLNGEQNTEEYRQLAAEAATLSDTLSDVKRQTSILANDDAKLQGLVSGVQGLSGAFTAATGVMSLFASKNEDLMKIQARLQSVMAITMGLQQAFNTLNKDSAFRLVTVAKAKNILTAANHRLAVALGGSTVAATALMATLTLGLSVVVTALIVAWEKFSSAQEEAAKKSQELAEVEAQGRAEMIKTRYEIDTTRESLKNFSGSKDEEKKKCDELNRKYGEAFGYYDTVAQWYDVLTEKAETYIQMLFLQAKAQSLVNKAVEADEELNKHKATKPGEGAETDMGFLGRAWQHISKGKFKAREAIDRHNEEAYESKVKELEQKRDNALEEAQKLNKQAEELGKKSGVGGHTDPTKTTPKNKPTKTDKKDEEAERERQKQAQEKLGQELADLQRQNDATDIAAMKEGAAKKLREIENEYQARKNTIDKQEADWKRDNKKAGVETGDNGLTAAQSAALKKARELNDQTAAAARQSELDAARRAWEEYLAEYGSFEEKRQAIQALYAAKMEEAGYAGEKAALQKELDGKLKELNFDEFKAGIDFAEVFGNIDTQSSAALTTLRDKLKGYISKAAKDLKPDDLKALREALTRIDLKITERNPFEGFKNDLEELKAAYEKVRQAQEDLNAVTDGAKVYVEEYDAETGKVIKKLLTQEQAERRLAQAQSERFTKMAEATQSLHAGVEKAREYGEAAEAVMDMLGDLGVQLPEEIGGIVSGYGQALDGLASIDLTKPASIITGGIKTLAGLGKATANILSLGGIDFGGQKSIRRYEAAKAEYEKYMAVLDRVIAKQKQLVASMDASDYLNADNSYNKAREAVAKSEQAARNLGRQYLDSGASKGFLGIGSSASRGVSQRKDMSNAAWAEFNALKRQTDEMQKLGLSMQTMNDASTGRMKGLFDMNAKQLEWLQANAPTFWAQLHDDTRKYLEQIIACGDEWEEIEAARRESLTKMTFDEFYSSWLEKIKDMKSDVKDVADAMEEQFQNAILTSLMEKKYRQQLQNLYKQWAEMTESGGKLDDAEIEALRKERDRIAAEAIRDRNELAETFGWKDETATAQSGKAGGFNAMSQDQGTKLEGLFVSGQIHWASIDDKLTDVATQMSIAGGTLLKIEENTGANARSAAAILDEMKKMIRDGIKVK